MAHDVFISYSSKDKAVADAVCMALESADVPCWMAPRDIVPGQQWSESIIDAIHSSRALVLIFSESANQSPQVLREVERAVSLRLDIVPFRIEDVPLTKAMEYFISVPHWLNAYPPPLEPHLRFLTENVLRLLQRAPVLPPVLKTPEPTPSPIVSEGNLPRQLTSFVGREKEVDEIAALIVDTPLVTLTGSGGCGKTRLALRVAEELQPQHRDGAWYVPLDSVSSPDRVAEQIAKTLGVREEPNRSIDDVLMDHLRDRHLLLLLDNCEHVVDGCAQVVESLLHGCHGVRVLATSREALDVPGETVWQVPSLGLPDARRTLSAAELAGFAAVRLFVDRARAVLPSFALTDANAGAVAQICRRLDGIPLAIELAAARVKVLPVEQIDRRLDDRFKLLTGGGRTVLARHQTLRAAMDWSYDLLAEAEKALFRRLSLFVGGWSLEAAEAVCADDTLDAFEILDTLAPLVDKSLVVPEEGDDARYRFLESVRDYAAAKLRESGETDALTVRYRRHYVEFARTEDDARWQERMEAEEGNVRAALAGLLDDGDAVDAAVLAIALVPFWERLGRFNEARQMLRRCLERETEIGDAVQTACLEEAAGWFAYLQKDHESAHAHQRRNLEARRSAGDADGEAKALNNLALIALATHRREEARHLFESSLEIARRINDEPKQAARLSNLGLLAIQEGSLEEAAARLEEALALYRKRRDLHGMGATLCNLGDLAIRRGDWTAAETICSQSLELFRQLKDRPGMAFSLANLAESAMRRGDPVARERIGEAMELCAATDLRWLLPLLLEIDARIDTDDDVEPVERRALVLALADRLREDLSLPRSPEEQNGLEPWIARIPEAAKRTAEGRLLALSTEEIVLLAQNQ